MAIDLALELIQATVQLEQPLGDGTRTVGTGFLISSPGPDGRPRTVLITANHVFQRMPGQNAKVGYRIANADGTWRYSPQPLKIRDDGGRELWTHHPTRDIAAISIKAPREFAQAALPMSYLASDETFTTYQVNAGDEMMALGFPRGLSANAAGFPILRSGRVASYPLGPATVFPTFLLDFSVFPGNSGGPVFMARPAPRTPGVAPAESGETGESQSRDVGFIAGLLTQQVELNNERLEIGIVTHARYVRETIALLTDPLAAATAATAAGATAPATPGGGADRTAAADEAAARN